MRLDRSLIISFTVALMVPSVLQAGYSDCTVSQSTSGGVTFTYHVDSLAWLQGPSGPYPQIPNGALNTAAGHAPFPGRIVYVALPPGSQSVSASVVSQSPTRTVRWPTPAADASDAQPTAGFAPIERVVVDGVFTLRGLRIARLLLHPVLVEAPGGELDFCDDMTVDLRFDRTAPVSGMAPAIRDDAFSNILNTILLNPEEGRAWRSTDNKPGSRKKSAAETHPFAGSNEWIALRTRGEGVFAVAAADLRSSGVSFTGRDPRAFRVFAGPGRQLSTRVTDPAPPFAEVAVRIIGEADGRFDAADTLLFWAQALNRWEVDSEGRLVDVVHRYDRDNVYWLVLNGDFSDPPRRIPSADGSPRDGSLTLFSGFERVRHEKETFSSSTGALFRPDVFGVVSYYTWYWRNQRQGAISVTGVRNAVPAAPARIEFGTFAGLYGRDPSRLSINNVPMQARLVRPGVGEDGSTITTFELPSFDPRDDFLLYFDGPLSDNHYLDYYSIDYQRGLDLSFGPLRIASPDTTAAATFVVSNAVGADVWDVTDPGTPASLNGVEAAGSVLRLGADLSAGSRRVYSIVRPSQRRRIEGAQAVTPVDLHTPAAQVDYIAIGPRAFGVSLAEFLDYRAATDGLSTRFVALEDIYNSFSYGIADPVAIRRFLRHTHLYWPDPTPAFCLLVGDGTFDYLDHSDAHAVNYVPPYIVKDEIAVSDESYVYFSDRAVLDAESESAENPFPDMLIGRWPVRSVEEIRAITAKIKRYESDENLGNWRSRVMMVADDEFGDRARGSVREDFHIEDAERIVRNTIPARFDIQKIYLTEYPFNNPGCLNPDARGCTKPAAKAAIIDGLNAGVAVFDYLGHGNADVLAHEHVFERVTDLPRLVNTETPTAVLTFSCSIGFFDDPVREGMSEEWFRMPNGGAVSVVSATRQAFALANADLNEEVFNLLLKGNVTGIAAALYTGKLLRQYFEPRCRFGTNCTDTICPCENDRGYMLFGDPAMRLGIPDLRVQFASIAPDSLTALSSTRVEGTITDSAGVLQSGFDGRLSVTVRDAPRPRHYPLSGGLSIDYEMPGGTLYRGQVDVTDGQFAFDFIVPKDVSYGAHGARILGHAVGAGKMAGGAVDSIGIASTVNPVVDTAGPQIRLETVAGEPLSDGFVLAEDARIIALIQDPTGINMTGASGHRLEARVAGMDRALVDLTDAFLYDVGFSDRGRAEFGLEGIGRGPHRLTIKAWDNADNSTALSVDIDVTEPGRDDEFRLTEFLNYPNPFDPALGPTGFYFRSTHGEVPVGRIRIFTLAGRLIWQGSGSGEGDLVWNGRDAEGDEVANGVYIAQVEVNGQVATQAGRTVEKTVSREAKLVVSR